MAFEPNFRIAPGTAKALMRIEVCREAVEKLPISPRLIATLKESARLLSTHYSTQIEGNRLTAGEVAAVIFGRTRIVGRERDEREVRNYYRAIERMESLAASPRPLRELDIQQLHGLVFNGRARATPYRDGQNVIRESGTGVLVYLPPEAKDVPRLMRELVRWINGECGSGELPAPVVAALAHYQFATIHPYYDGNGRTARLLANLVLNHQGYGLKGIYSLEEYYARDLHAYYEALAVGGSGSDNYYLGRAAADVTGFVRYFCTGMAVAFENVRAQAVETARTDATDTTARLRALRPIQRQVLALFAGAKVATSAEIAKHLKVTARQGRELCARWVGDGFLEIENPSKKARAYRLAPHVEAIVVAS